MAVALDALFAQYDANGDPLSGGMLYTYAAGTTTPLPSYTDGSGSTPNTNPIILDAAGRANVWLQTNVPYKLVLADSFGAIIKTVDNVYAGASPEQLSTAGIVPSTGGDYSGLVNFNGGALFLGNATQNLATLNSLGIASVQTSNLWINSDLGLNQRVAASTADGAYGFDRVVNLCETGSTTLSQLAQPADGIPYAMRQLQPDVTPKRMGSVQIVEARNCLAYRGKQLVFAPKFRCSIATTVRVALVAWTGTLDSPTRDVVNNWASTTYTAGNFFVANTATIAVGAVGLSANTWQDVPISSASPGGVVVPSAMNNLYMVWWTDAAVAQNVTLDSSVIRCGQGTALPLWTPPDAATELVKCQRYYSKSYQYTIAPGTNTGLTGGMEDGPGTGVTFTNLVSRALFPVPARTASPTVTIYDSVGGMNAVSLFNPGLNNGQGVGALGNLSERGFEVVSQASSPQRMLYHWTMQAEIGV